MELEEYVLYALIGDLGDLVAGRFGGRFNVQNVSQRCIAVADFLYDYLWASFHRSLSTSVDVVYVLEY